MNDLADERVNGTCIIDGHAMTTGPKKCLQPTREDGGNNAAIFEHCAILFRSVKYYGSNTGWALTQGHAVFINFAGGTVMERKSA
jgi:hypothetical protein